MGIISGVFDLFPTLDFLEPAARSLLVTNGLSLFLVSLELVRLNSFLLKLGLLTTELNSSLKIEMVDN